MKYFKLSAICRSAVCISRFFCLPTSPNTFALMSLRLIGHSYMLSASFIHARMSSGLSAFTLSLTGMSTPEQTIFGTPRLPASSVTTNFQSSMSLPRASCCLTVNVTPVASFFLMLTKVSVTLLPSSVPRCPRIFDSSSLPGRGFMWRAHHIQIPFFSARAISFSTNAALSALSLKSPMMSRTPSMNTMSGFISRMAFWIILNLF